MQTEKRWTYEGSDLDTERDFRTDPEFQRIIDKVEDAILLLKSASWSDLRKVVEHAGVTRAKLAAAVESLNLTGKVGIEQKGDLERLHHIPSVDDETKNKLYGQRPNFYRSWQKSYLSL